MTENNNRRSAFRFPALSILQKQRFLELGIMDYGLITGVLSLHLQKAFYIVNHRIIISKLKFYGI